MTCPSPEAERADRLYTGRSYGTRERGPRAGWQMGGGWYGRTGHVDAYPDQVFTGTIESLSPGTGSVFSLLPPENATGNFVKVVQRIPVKIRLDMPASAPFVLRPGMSVIATVTTRD